MNHKYIKSLKQDHGAPNPDHENPQRRNYVCNMSEHDMVNKQSEGPPRPRHDNDIERGVASAMRPPDK